MGKIKTHLQEIQSSKRGLCKKSCIKVISLNILSPLENLIFSVKHIVCAVKFTIQARNRMLIEIALLSQGVFKAFQGMEGLFQIL
jgi:hypothetical protein